MAYLFTGSQPLEYPAYLDVTDPSSPKTLVAVPGESYDIQAAEPGLPVPPDLRCWQRPQPPASPHAVTLTAKAQAQAKAKTTTTEPEKEDRL